MPGKAGQVMVVDLELMGQRLTFMNGGPNFTLDEAFSLSVACETQADIDRLWDALADRPSACGWTRDRFGVVWQINYAGLPRLMTSQERINKVMAAMMTMVKIDVQKLEDAVA
jgi:predicted 3-demethylubiquinone-9 3-methyltransferase (glyoxalase superfamily)